MPVSYRSKTQRKSSHEKETGRPRRQWRPAGSAGQLMHLPWIPQAARYSTAIPWVLAGAAFILSRGRVMSVLAPFHIAFAAAVVILFPSLARWVIAGAVIGRALWSGTADALFDGIALLAIAGAVHAVRQVFPRGEHGDKAISWRWAAAAAAGTGLGTGLHTLIMSPNSFGVVVLSFRVILAALLTPLFAHALEAIHRRFIAGGSGRAESEEEAEEYEFWPNHDEGLCIAVLGAAVVASLAGLQWGPVAPASVAAGLLVLGFAAWGGAAAGAAAGASVAAVTMLGGSIGVLPVAVHALAGLLAGLLREFGGIGCAAGYATGVVLMAAFTLDSGSMTAELWSLMPAIILFTIIDVSSFKKDRMFDTAGGGLGSGPPQKGVGPGRPFFVIGGPKAAAPAAAAAGGEGSSGPAGTFVPDSGDPGSAGVPGSRPFAGPREPGLNRASAGEKRGSTSRRGAGAGPPPAHPSGAGDGAGLAGLASVVAEMAAALEPSQPNGDSFQRRKMHGLMSKLASDVCSGCVHEHTCWDREFFTTYKGLGDLIARKETTGEAHARHLPDKLRRRCPRTERLVAGINHAYELLHTHRSWWQRLYDARSLVAGQMLALSNAAAGMAAHGPGESSAAVAAAPARDSRFGGSAAVGQRGQRSFGAPVGRGPTLVRPSSLRGGSRGTSAAFNPTAFPSAAPSAPSVTYRAAAARVARDRKLVSGDSYLYRLINTNRLAMVLSDGMGAGVTAAKESRTTINLLERCLELGLAPEQAIEMVNNVLLLRFAEDTFATLDLTLIDLSRPTAQFIKIGAPPSFVRRRDHVSIIRAGTPPMGILEEVHMEVAHRHLRSGDLIVMVTDGVIAAWDSVAAGEEWIKGFLANLPQDKPRWVATQMMREALRRSQGRPPDDMTALVVKLT